MVNEPGKLTAAQRAPEKERRAGQFGIPQGEEEENYEKLLDQYVARKFAEGEVMKGRVLKITDTDVVVDIGYKSEGVIPVTQFIDAGGQLTIKVGDVVDVLIEDTEDGDGHIVLSKEKAEKVRVWEEVEKAYNENTIIRGRVIERIKGGLSVDIGVRAFLPGSQIDVRPVKNLDSLKGKEIECRVIKLNRKRGNIVLSRKLVLETEQQRKKAFTLEVLREDAEVRGVVKNITDYGVFVDLGGIDGLLHVTDLSWGRVNHPSEMFNVGDEITVKILKYDREKERVSLGYKQLTPDPWTLVRQVYPVGARVTGKVVNITDYGAFVELEAGVEGLIHVSEMSWSKRVKHPSKLLQTGQDVEAVVLDVDMENRRISLGMKQTEPDPWSTLAERYAIGSVIAGRVRNLTDFGAFIEVEEGIDGLVHVSDISPRRIKHPSEVLKKGERVEAVILNIDTENHRLSLGIKQLQPDIWEQFFTNHRLGDLVRGRIVRHAPFGVFVELDEGIEGLCHVSELDEADRQNLENRFRLGEEDEFKIIKLSPTERKIGLSHRAIAEDAERREYDSYRDSADGTATLADLFHAKDNS
ncbi:MAG: 30S ribosomal protein S1 [Acidobacteria bacterium]|nr:MAG: 30S ribosomal protein S1 [Acidobacteriota bacterium]